MKIKLNADLKGFKKGDIIKIDDKNGYPIDAYWKRRFQDAKIDNCLEVVEEKKQQSFKSSRDNEKKETNFKKEDE